MKNFTNQATKVWRISERALLVISGGLALYAGIMNETQSIHLTALVLGGLCILAGLLPMFLAYAKNVWNNK